MNPSEDFVKHFILAVYDGRLTQATKDQFTPLVRQAFHGFISNHVNRRLNAALRSSDSSVAIAPSSFEPEETTEEPQSGIETTDDEIEGFMIVKAICREAVDVSRIIMRDTLSYCGVLLDDNNRKPICRLRFNSARSRSVSLFDADKTESRHRIEKIDDLWQFADQLKSTCLAYDQDKLPGDSPPVNLTDQPTVPAEADGSTTDPNVAG